MTLDERRDSSLHASDGMRIAYKTYGTPRPTKPAFLLVHGGWQAKECWDKQVEEFARTAFVITFDLAFCGQTIVTDQESSVLDTNVRCMSTVIDHFGLKQTGYIAVLWSYGALVFHNMVLSHGIQGVRAIVLVDTALNYPAQAADLPQVGGLFSTDIEERNQALLAFVGALTYHPLPTEDFYKILGWNAQAYLHHASTDMQQVPGDIATTIADIPALLIQGAKDVIFPSDGSQQLFNALVSKDQGVQRRIVVLPECGHSPHLEQAELFNKEVLAFYQEVITL